MSLDRRGFLSLSALAGGGLLLGISSGSAEEVGKPTEQTIGEFSPNVFVRISTDGTVTIVSHKPEMGQGVLTSIPMILAEELDIDWKTVKLDIGKADPAYGNQLSGGSRSVPNSYQPMRQIGATARAMLVTAAAQTWGVPESELTTEAGTVLHAPSVRKASYGELVAKAKTLPVPAADTVKLKDPKDFKLLGTRVGGYQNQDIVTGKPLFGIDQKVEGMLFAVYQKCPVFAGKVVSANLDKIKTLPGVKDAFVRAPPIWWVSCPEWRSWRTPHGRPSARASSWRCSGTRAITRMTAPQNSRSRRRNSVRSGMACPWSGTMVIPPRRWPVRRR